MKVIAIGGEPKTGKTTLIKKLLESKNIKRHSYNGVDFIKTENLVVIGKYDGAQFDGTDRMSMSIQPKFIAFLTELKNANLNYNVILEGDRLLNSSTIGFLIANNISHKIIILKCKDEEMQTRSYERQQSDKFLKSKKTKIKNICEAYKVTCMDNSDKEDQAKIIGLIMDFLKTLHN